MSDAAKQFDAIAFHEDVKAQESFRAAVVAGLSNVQKSIPCRFLYDAAGSALFDRICETPEYYVTRTETEILRSCAADIAALTGPDCQVIELGSGSSRKIRILLDALERPRGYVAIDISRDHLRTAAMALKRSYPWLQITALCADYSHPPALPAFAGTKRKLGFFPGSTIGNLTPQDAQELLSLWAEWLGTGAALLIGVDLKKSPAILNAAYNDAGGVTAAFTKNILARANRELGTNFVSGGFVHDARYVPEHGRMEIYLRSLARQTVRMADKSFEFAEGERIHVEYSFKYSTDEFQALARASGFAPQAVWTDPEGLFSLHFLTVC